MFKGSENLETKFRFRKIPKSSEKSEFFGIPKNSDFSEFRFRFRYFSIFRNLYFPIPFFSEPVIFSESESESERNVAPYDILTKNFFEDVFK